MIIYTCPKCGHDLKEEVLTSYPPIYKKYCSNCGWSNSEQEEIVRVPFKEDYVKTNLNSYVNNYLPSTCDNCSNNPKNGGSGICHCTLGTIKTTC